MERDLGVYVYREKTFTHTHPNDQPPQPLSHASRPEPCSETHLVLLGVVEELKVSAFVSLGETNLLGVGARKDTGLYGLSVKVSTARGREGEQVAARLSGKWATTTAGRR